MVTLVHTRGRGSFELYSAQLARRLPHWGTTFYADTIRTSRNASLLSKTSAVSLAQEVAFVRELRRLGPVHLPNQHLARYASFLDHSIVTVHDLIRLKDIGRGLIDGELGKRERLYLRADARGLERAAHIIAVSWKTAQEVIGVGLDPRKVTVVHNGVDHQRFRPVPAQRTGYVLYVGTEQPRKNLPRLIEAVAQTDLRLVKAGVAGDGDRAVTMRAIRENGMTERVDMLGYVPEATLPYLYAGAEALVLPSLYEGFGLPVLEAMACGCPVVTTDGGAIPEAAGRGAVYVDPQRPEDIAEGILRAIAQRERLRRFGFEQASKFSWDRCAQETAAVYERTRSASRRTASRTVAVVGSRPRPASAPVGARRTPRTRPT